MMFFQVKADPGEKQNHVCPDVTILDMRLSSAKMES